jgi:hypothetical protein
MASSITIDKITSIDGVLGARLIRADSVQTNASDDLIVALDRAQDLVERYGDCSLRYGGKDDGVTVAANCFRFDDVTVIVAIRTGHRVAKSLRRLMRQLAGLPRNRKQADA